MIAATRGHFYHHDIMIAPGIPEIFRGKVITIDGPAGSGKSTTARLLAQRLGFEYLDTGATYRVVALLGKRHGTDLTDDRQVAELLTHFHVRFEFRDGVNHVFLDDEDVTTKIRTPEIDKLVSPVAAHAGIREFLVAWQKTRARSGNVVLEGRDTSTVVCPDADVKIYLNASLDTRAHRRLVEYERRGEAQSIDAIRNDIVRRDHADTQRDVGPLRCAADSLVVDTSNLTIDEQVERVYQACLARLTARHVPGAREE
ncbi:MAG: (d)CMP kinase [Candidatus Zixiibacteriota bacterium]